MLLSTLSIKALSIIIVAKFPIWYFQNILTISESGSVTCFASFDFVCLLLLGVPYNFLLKARYDILHNKNFGTKFILIWLGVKLCLLFTVAVGVRAVSFHWCPDFSLSIVSKFA